MPRLRLHGYLYHPRVAILSNVVGQMDQIFFGIKFVYVKKKQ